MSIPPGVFPLRSAPPARSFTTDGAAPSGVVAAAIATGDQGVAARTKARFAPTKVLLLWVVVLAAFHLALPRRRIALNQRVP